VRLGNGNGNGHGNLGLKWSSRWRDGQKDRGNPNQRRTAAATAAHSGAKVERHVQTFRSVKIALLSQLQRQLQLQLQFFKRSNKQGRRRRRRHRHRCCCCRCFSASGVATSTLPHRLPATNLVPTFHLPHAPKKGEKTR